MKVRFSSIAEFLAELEADGPPSKLVRLTAGYRHAGTLPVQTVTVIAGYINGRGELVELTRYVGDHWGHKNQTTDETERRKLDGMATIESAAQELGLTVRAGQFAEGD